MDVIFVEPCFPANQREFVRALASVGARVIGIGERDKSTLDDELRHWLSHYEQIGNVTDEAQLTKTVKWLQGRSKPQRLEAVVEAHVMAAARVRATCGIPGVSVEATFLCRDKPAMKEVLRQGGVPCAESTAADSADEVRAFIERVGYPVILKPRDGAGASGASRIESDGELEPALRALGHGRSIAVEEFIEGHEGFFDTLTLRGRVVHEFATHYYPNVLEAMRTRWISPQFLTTNRIDTPGYDEVKVMAQKVVTLLGIETSATHMEWFSGAKGLKFSEIGCRPPGVRAWDLYNVGNDMDLYREWAMLISHGRPSQRPSRRLAAGIIALRPDRDGRIAGYSGLDIINRHFGAHMIDAHLPPEGTPTQGVEAGYMANAWMRFQHEDYDALRRIMDTVGETVKVRAR